MLAHMEAMETQTIIELREQESVLVLIRQRETGTVILIEDAKFHDEHPCLGATVEARLDWTAVPDVKLKQVVLGIREGRDAAV